jgi:NhaP-type Na+/H+ or K+/H+ antiporter
MALAPRGIVAAAVSSEFALQLESHGRTDAGIVSSLVLACIVGTVSFYGLLSGRIARWLGLAETRPRGVLFVGATRAVREIAAALHELGVPSVLVDTNLANIQEARRLDLRAWHGSILSDRCLDEVDLTGIGCLCAMTASDEVNLLTMRRARGVFEGRSLYQLPPRSREDSRFGLSAHGQGRWLFGPTATSEHLEVRLARGARVTATQVTEPAAGRPLPGEADLLLFALQPDGSIAVATADAPLPLRPGCMVVAIVEPAPQPELPKSASAPGRT